MKGRTHLISRRSVAFGMISFFGSVSFASAATGTISASYPQLYLNTDEKAATVISWSKSNCSGAEVWLSVDGGVEQLWAYEEHDLGVKEWSLIDPGHRYTFRLYAERTHTTLLASTTVNAFLHNEKDGVYELLDYYPLTLGYKWIYEKMPGYDLGLTTTNVRPCSGACNRIIQSFIYSEDSGQDSLMEYDVINGIYDLGDTCARGDAEFKSLFSPKMIWIPRRAAVGDEFFSDNIRYARSGSYCGIEAEGPWSLPVRSTSVKLEAVISEMVVPAGTFHDVLHLKHVEDYLWAEDAPHFVHEIYLAKGVGIVKVVSKNLTNGQKVFGTQLKKFQASKEEQFRIEITPNLVVRPKSGSTPITFVLKVSGGTPDKTEGIVHIRYPNGECHDPLDSLGGHWEGNTYIFPGSVNDGTLLGTYLVGVKNLKDGSRTIGYVDVVDAMPSDVSSKANPDSRRSGKPTTIIHRGPR